MESSASYHSPKGGIMTKQDSDESRSVALYWDFENLHASLCEEKDPGSYAGRDIASKRRSRWSTFRHWWSWRHRRQLVRLR